jgi:hypothetical protein
LFRPQLPPRPRPARQQSAPPPPEASRGAESQPQQSGCVCPTDPNRACGRRGVQLRIQPPPPCPTAVHWPYATARFRSLRSTAAEMDGAAGPVLARPLLRCVETQEPNSSCIAGRAKRGGAQRRLAIAELAQVPATPALAATPKCSGEFRPPSPAAAVLCVARGPAARRAAQGGDGVGGCAGARQHRCGCLADFGSSPARHFSGKVSPRRSIGARSTVLSRVRAARRLQTWHRIRSPKLNKIRAQSKSALLFLPEKFYPPAHHECTFFSCIRSYAGIGN